MTYDDLDRRERMALVALVRLMIRMDGEFSRQEVGALAKLGRELGDPAFWDELNASHVMETADVAVLVDTVERPAVRAWMHGVLAEIAAVDGVDEAEGELLSWLSDVWSL